MAEVAVADRSPWETVYRFCFFDISTLDFFDRSCSRLPCFA